MARRSPWTSVEEHFASRHRPYGRNVDLGARNRIAREPAMESHQMIQKNQAPEDRHASNYNNDVADDWRRGGGKGGATTKPSFDKSNAWRMKDSNNWHSGSDPAVIRKPPNNHDR
jgi:hypothetical protein